MGYGTAAAVLHGPLISATDGLDVVSIVTRDPARAAAAVRSHPGAQVHSDVAEVLRGGHDLVVIATPPRYHAALAERAIRAGIAVVIEKPFAPSSVGASRIVDLALARAVPLTVFQNRRWDSDFLTVRALLQSGRLGRIHRVESSFEPNRATRPIGWQDQTAVADGGGVLIDLGSHLIDQAVLLLGAPMTVHAEIHRRRPGAVADDDTFVSLTFAGDVVCHLRMGYVAGSGGPAFRILGSNGTFEIDGTDPQWAALERGESPAGRDWGRQTASGALTGGEGDKQAVMRIRPRHGAYPRFYRGVRDALLRGGPMPVDPVDAVVVLRVIEAARLAAKGGRVVEIGGIRDHAPARVENLAR